MFYVMWIPHYALVAEPLYALLRKEVDFIWGEEQAQAMESLKEALISPPVLRPLVYGDGMIVILTVDASPVAAGWALSQETSEGQRYVARFGAKTFNERQRRYPQHKRELWGIRCAMHQERNYLIGASVLLETDCLILLGMIANCTTADIAILRWIAFIRTFNPELKHIKGSDNVVVDMLSRAHYKVEGQSDD